MEGMMSPRLWSDEDRLFIPRMGGWSINFKYIARKLGWVKQSSLAKPSQPQDPDIPPHDETPEERLKRTVEQSRFEDHTP
jgi:hypothetical protein